jgi:predicted DNA-binding protein
VKKEESRTFSVRMPITLRQKLDQLARAQDRRASDTVRRLIRLAYAELERSRATPHTESFPDDSQQPVSSVESQVELRGKST